MLLERQFSPSLSSVDSCSHAVGKTAERLILRGPEAPAGSQLAECAYASKMGIEAVRVELSDLVGE